MQGLYPKCPPSGRALRKQGFKDLSSYAWSRRPEQCLGLGTILTKKARTITRLGNLRQFGLQGEAQRALTSAARRHSVASLGSAEVPEADQTLSNLLKETQLLAEALTPGLPNDGGLMGVIPLKTETL